MSHEGFLRTLLITALPLALAGQTTQSKYCEAPHDIWEQVLDAIAVDREKDGKLRSDDDFHSERKARVDAVYGKYPGEFHIRRAHLTYSKREVAGEELIAEFKKLAEANPDDTGAQHLYAESLVGKRTPEAIKILEAIVAKDPAFPWPYRILTNIYRSPVFSNREKAKTYAKAFIDRCPDTTIAVQLATNVDTFDGLAALAQRTRERIGGKQDREILNAYTPLWRLEFKVTPAPEHARVRLQIKHDLKFIETLDRKRYRNAGDLLEQGYGLTGDKEALAKLHAGRTGVAAQNNAYFHALEEWSKTNPDPQPDAALSVRDEFHRKSLEFHSEWAQKAPTLDFIALQRLRAMADLKATPDDELIAEGDRALKKYREYEPFVFSMFTTPETVAQILAKRGVGLDRIPALLQEGEAAYQRRERAEGEHSDLYRSPDEGIRKENMAFTRHTMSWETLVMAYSKQGRRDEARRTLAQWENALDARRQRAAGLRTKRAADPPADPSQRDDTRRYEDEIVKGIGFEESRYYSGLAELARAEKRNTDALAMYQAALRSLSNSSRAPADPDRSDPATKARELWLAAGGTNEGWRLWLATAKSAAASPASESKWSPVTKALPDFTLNDKDGKSWTVAKVKGKTTLLNVWATWCGPCRNELPHLQKLHDKIKDREDVQVITLNVDENAGLVDPYLRENKFTFPVLFAREYVDALVGPLGIPTNWISDRDGSLKSESIGFGGDGEGWLKSTLAELERVRENPKR